MKNNFSTVKENLEIKKWKKRSVANRFADIETKTAIRTLNESLGDGDQLCVRSTDVPILIVEQKCYSEYAFFHENKMYLPVAQKKLMALHHFEEMKSVEELVKEIGQKLSELLSLSETSGSPICCLKEGDANMACLLADFHVKAILVNKHWKDLPNGARLRDKCDQDFEELCSALKIPRRTRAIMKRRSQVSEVVPVINVAEGGANA